MILDMSAPSEMQSMPVRSRVAFDILKHISLEQEYNVASRVRKMQNIASFDDGGNILPVSFSRKKIAQNNSKWVLCNFDKGKMLPLSRCARPSNFKCFKTSADVEIQCIF